MCVATGNWLAWNPGLAATAKTLPCLNLSVEADTEYPASINFCLVSWSGTATSSPVPFAFSPLVRSAPLLGTYFLPLGAVNASLGKTAWIYWPWGTSVLASTNKGYNLPSLSTNNLYAFFVLVGCTDALSALLNASPPIGITPKAKDAASIPAPNKLPLATFLARLVTSFASLTPGIKSVATSATCPTVGLTLPCNSGPRTYLSKNPPMVVLFGFSGASNCFLATSVFPKPPSLNVLLVCSSVSNRESLLSFAALIASSKSYAYLLVLVDHLQPSVLFLLLCIVYLL